MSSMCCKRLEYLRNCFAMLEMTKEIDKRLIYVENDVYMCKMAEVFEKRLIYVWEMTQICGKKLKQMGNGLSI